jgi:hypothetical protein
VDVPDCEGFLDVSSIGGAAYADDSIGRRRRFDFCLVRALAVAGFWSWYRLWLWWDTRRGHAVRLTAIAEVSPQSGLARGLPPPLSGLPVGERDFLAASTRAKDERAAAEIQKPEPEWRR